MDAFLQPFASLLASTGEVFYYWFCYTGWTLLFVLAIGGLFMRNLGVEYRIGALVLLGITVLNGYYVSVAFHYETMHALFLTALPMVIFAGGPAIWFSLQAYLDPLFQVKPVHGIHFVPGVIASLATGSYVFTVRDGLWPYEFVIAQTGVFKLAFAFSIVYGLFSLYKFVRIYREDDGEDRAAQYRHRFLWIFAFVFVVLAVCAFLVLVLRALSPVVPLIFSTFLMTILVIFYCRYPHVFQVLMESIEAAPHRRTNLTEAVVEHIKLSLVRLMEEEELYKDSDLTMPGLAEMTDVTPHQLSEYLNFHVGTNFSRFINGYRIESIKRVLLDKPSKAIIEIAFENGFSSKSTFNVAFLEVAGITPSAWRKANKTTVQEAGKIPAGQAAPRPR